VPLNVTYGLCHVSNTRVGGAMIYRLWEALVLNSELCENR
jgi:hypothetical protein